MLKIEAKLGKSMFYSIRVSCCPVVVTMYLPGLCRSDKKQSVHVKC